MLTEPDRFGLRLALAPAALFVVGMAFDWPMSYMGAVLTVLFLKSPTPPTLQGGIALVLSTLAITLACWALFSVLLPYPFLFLLALILVVAGAFALSIAGKSMLLVFLVLLGGLLMPVLVDTSTELALKIAIWLPLNMVFALLAVWAAFALLPASAGARSAVQEAGKGAATFDPARRLLRMTLVTVPFAMVFFLYGGGDVVPPLYVALITLQLAGSTAKGPEVAIGMLLANVAGGLVAIAAFELVVMAPFFPFMALMTTLACLGFAKWYTSERKDSGLAGSAMTAMLILFGGAMAPLSDAAEVAMFDRLAQVGTAIIWVLVAFVAVDTFLPERVRGGPNWRNGRQPGRGQTPTPAARRV